MSDSEGPTPTRRGLLAATAGVASATTAGTAGAQEDDQGDGDGGGETYTVDMTDDLIFDPEEITVAPGDTVVWENVGSVGHSVTAYEDEIPDGAEYFASGGFDSEQAARDAYPAEGDIPGGESYEHTFETTGEFAYFCIPHEQVGMIGTVVVQEGGSGDGRWRCGRTAAEAFDFTGAERFRGRRLLRQHRELERPDEREEGHQGQKEERGGQQDVREDRLALGLEPVQRPHEEPRSRVLFGCHG
jgi:plastocyanin